MEAVNHVERALLLQYLRLPAADLGVAGGESLMGPVPPPRFDDVGCARIYPGPTMPLVSALM